MIDLGSTFASHVLFVHVVEDVLTNYLDDFADDRDLVGFMDQLDGYELGDKVSEYVLEFDDGSAVSVPILRRFAIQQGRYQWGSNPFACVPAAEDVVFPSPDEAQAIGHVPEYPLELEQFGEETRCTPAVRLWDLARADNGMLWIYALPNPAAEKPLRRITCRPVGERSAIYAVSVASVVEHPLRPGTRRKLRLRLPDGVGVNSIGEAEDVDIDLGTVISARLALDYDHERWTDATLLAEPVRSQREVLVEYAAHPQARLRVGAELHELGDGIDHALVVAPAQRPVRMRFLDADSGERVAVRLHLHGAAGEYLPPRGHHRKVGNTWSGRIHPEFVNVENQYAYVDGECVVDLPLGTVYVEISRGFETVPVRTSIEVGAGTDVLVFELDRVLRWRERGWVSADTHVHFLSPHTALLEGRAEGVNVVNLLVSQWGEWFTNVADFDGATTLGEDNLDGRGEFLVRVGSENRMPVLGHISLLGYSGELIQPLCTGGPDESAFGDPVEVTMAEWAQRCIDQGGLVVMPHSPVPQLERAADIVLGVVHAIELMNFNPLHPDNGQLSAYGIADWYRYLNLGYHLPLVGGSDKMSTEILLGGVRTYVNLGERDLTYEAWMDAIREGNTFVTVGPLASLRVEGVAPGGQVKLPAEGGTLEVEWEVESVNLPIDRVEIIVGGLVAEEASCAGELSACGRVAVSVSGSTWIALRVRGSYHGRPKDVAAHTSAVQVLVEGSELFSESDAGTVLDQIEGAIAYVDTLAPRPDARRFQELRATLEVAHNLLHQRMQAVGIVPHQLHDPDQPHEH